MFSFGFTLFESWQTYNRHKTPRCSASQNGKMYQRLLDTHVVYIRCLHYNITPYLCQMFLFYDVNEPIKCSLLFMQKRGEKTSPRFIISHY